MATRLPLPDRDRALVYDAIAHLKAFADAISFRRLRREGDTWSPKRPKKSPSSRNSNGDRKGTRFSRDQAPLIAMFYGEALGLNAARRVIAERPAGGWSAIAEFWNSPTLRDLPPPGDVLDQPRVTSRWFALDLDVTVGTTQLHETGLIDARQPPARIAARRWTGDE